jgi:branched-subunit amino acid aminotransferase/4-amino-4-deoxychorismate lyase
VAEADAEHGDVALREGVAADAEITLALRPPGTRRDDDRRLTGDARDQLVEVERVRVVVVDEQRRHEREDSVDSVYQWSGGTLEPAGGGPPVALLVADSWLVDEGYERAAGAHWDRFGAACLAAGAEREELRRFAAAARAALPHDGRWFPRVELTAAGFALRVRRAPPPVREARVVVGAPGDPRRCPRRKGPDLELLAGLRASARARGGDELLLCDDSGGLLEGALSSLLWWEGDALCTTPAERTLPGVTRALLLAIAAQRGVELRVRVPQPAELAGRETWLTSALHGIRVVTAWVEPRQAAGAATRAPVWREELDCRG